MGEIIIKGKPFYFEEISWLDNNDELNKDDAKFMLSTIKRVLEQNGVHFLLNFGTLLGAVRDHDFIGHDYDIDLAMHVKYREKFLELIPELHKLNIKLCRYFYKGTIYSFYYKGIVTDFNIVFEPPFPYKFWFYQTLEKLYPKRFTKETDYLEFLGEQYEVPKNPERFLEYMYGRNWRIPQKGVHARLFPKWMILEKLWYKLVHKFRFLRAKYIYHIDKY